MEMTNVITPTGTLIRKIQPQCRCWLIRPPRAGPRARASAPIAAQMPMAVLRSLTLVNAAMMTASVAGISRAAPMPWIARLAMSIPPLVASPAASEDTVNRARPEEDPAPAVDVGEPAAGQQQPGHREQVAADHPLEPGHRQVQAVLDGRDRHVNDVVVQVSHERRQADRGQCPPTPGVFAGR